MSLSTNTMTMMQPSVFDRELKRCTQCVLPETFPGIFFDSEGICNYCREYRKVEIKGETALVDLLSKYKGRSREYDCIVPISGGRDSAYTLHQMVKKYGMRTLALTVDSGAIMPEGHRNIDRIVKALGVNHVWLKDDEHLKSAKRNTWIKFHAWMRKPSINTIVPVLNAGDKTMNLRIYNYAHGHGIPLVIGGNNIGNSSFEQEHFKTGFMGIFPDDHGRYSSFDKVRLSFLFAWEFLSNTYNWHWPVFSEYLSGAFVYFFESLQKPGDVVPIGFYDYIYWNEEEIVETITGELGWEGSSDSTATWRIDDAAYPLIDYLYYALLGFNEFDEHYSKLIREGQLTRKKALARLEADRLRIPPMKASLKDLGVDEEELTRVVAKFRDQLLIKILKD
jgi:glucosamine--fructose-6-phosphate aminotransferase (isomerizing)